MADYEPAPVLSLDELADALERERAFGRSIALANGCFDLLHVGHLRYLFGAAREAHVLVVALNGDESVRALKGSGRPLASEAERAELISSLGMVDYVTVFHELTVESLLSRLRPDVHCKGTDYTEQSVPEASLVRSYGGRVAIVGDPKDHSTSEMIARLIRR
ncbi:MAG TPA: adenylyltransferase/cytidyltransferase family protein [Thermoanaerobaculia bacterium]|nr:adenylyltransferase/cytidyltransferase family protein [Thermoanaerobaculia bacterium]